VTSAACSGRLVKDSRKVHGLLQLENDADSVAPRTTGSMNGRIGSDGKSYTVPRATSASLTAAGAFREAPVFMMETSQQR
jgi:hypothetical protein